MSVAMEDYRWLLSDAALPWLEVVLRELPQSGGPDVSLISRLRKDLSASRVHLVLEQAELRRRGEDKFSRAAKMFFTRKGLEQATDERLAVYKAARIPAGETVYDLCCGIGGDLIALAAGRTCVGIDADEVCTLFAERNCEVYGVSAAVTNRRVANEENFLPTDAVWHIDPDRRPLGRRNTRLELFEPPLETLMSLLTTHPHAALKLAPASDVPAEWDLQYEREWLESRGECRQQVVWVGDLALQPGKRAATIIDAAGATRTIVGQPEEPTPVCDSLGQFLFEPCAAVLAAKLVGALSREHGLAAVSPAVAYLTGDRAAKDAALGAFEVLDVLPLDRKQLKSYLRERRVGRLEIKKRGVKIDPELLRKEIIAAGDAEMTLVLTPVKNALKAIVVQRMACVVSPA